MAGRLHVDEVLAEMSSEELAEWRAFYQLEPWGDDWRRSSMIAGVIAETHRNQNERSEPFSMDDFMPVFTAPIADDDDTAVDIAESDDVDEQEPPWRKWKAAFALMAGATSQGA